MKTRACSAWAALALCAWTGAASAGPRWGEIQRGACKANGKRQYSSRLWDIQGSWEAACARAPATVAGQRFGRPTRCVNKGAFGMWGEFEVADASCTARPPIYARQPRWGGFQRGACVGAGKRVYSSRLSEVAGSWEAVCARTPAVVAGHRFPRPTRCVNRGVMGMWGEIDIPDSSCSTAPRVLGLRCGERPGPARQPTAVATARSTRALESTPTRLKIIPVHAVRVTDDPVGKAEPKNVTPITATEVARWVAFANQVYNPHGIGFRFVAQENGPDFETRASSNMYRSGGEKDPFWPQVLSWGNAVAAQHPHKMVVFVRGPRGWGGYSSRGYNFVVMPPEVEVCGKNLLASLWFAHEVGHYLGLVHTFYHEFKAREEAEAFFVNNGRDTALFNYDGFADTPGDLVIGNGLECTAPASVSLAGVSIDLALRNVMSYWYSETKELSRSQGARALQVAYERFPRECAANQILRAARCERCRSGVPNATQTACVSKRPRCRGNRVFLAGRCRECPAGRRPNRSGTACERGVYSGDLLE